MAPYKFYGWLCYGSIRGELILFEDVGMELKDKIALYCSREENVSRDSLQGFDNSYIMRWITQVLMTFVA